MKSLRVFDKEINLLCEIDGYDEFKVIRRFFGLSEFELRINIANKNIDKLEENNLIVIGKYYNKVGIILHKEADKEKDTGNFIIKGYTLEGLLSRRLIIPDVNKDFESCKGKQETIIKHFIDRNCINPSNAKRIIPRLIIATDKLRGNEDGWRSSYDNLCDKVKEISEFSELGWSVVLDKDTKNYVFDVIEGRDLTTSQRINPPVTFKKSFNNIANSKYIESIINSKNVVYAGTSEDATKLVLSAGDVEGFERMESFISVNSDDSLEIKHEADIELKELEKLKSFEIDVNPTKSFIYEKDYDLGDIVTVQDKKLKITMDARIVEIEEIHTKLGMSLKITFGTNIPNILTKIKKIEKKVR